MFYRMLILVVVVLLPSGCTRVPPRPKERPSGKQTAASMVDAGAPAPAADYGARQEEPRRTLEPKDPPKEPKGAGRHVFETVDENLDDEGGWRWAQR